MKTADLEIDTDALYEAISRKRRQVGYPSARRAASREDRRRPARSAALRRARPHLIDSTGPVQPLLRDRSVDYAAGFEDAFGIAATQSRGLMSAQFESMVKRIQHGFALRNGLTAAALAASGYVGIKRVFERGYGGWLSTFGQGHRTYPEEIYAGLGTFWETKWIAVKPYSAMGLLHAAIDAALELRSTANGSEIELIDVDMPDAAYGHGGRKAERPLQPIGAQMNAAYTVAVALLGGGVLIDQFSQDRINDDDVWTLIDRTLTHHERAYDHCSRLSARAAGTFGPGAAQQL